VARDRGLPGTKKSGTVLGQASDEVWVTRRLSLGGFAVLVLLSDPTVLVPQEPVGATARCRDGSYSFSSTPCTSRGGVAEVLAADQSQVHPASGAPEVMIFSAVEARHHPGEAALVCGVVASTRYLPRIPGKPTFLDLDQAYPYRVFSIVIWGLDRANFPHPPELTYLWARVCAAGRIDVSTGPAEIVVRSPNALRVGGGRFVADTDSVATASTNP